MSGINAHGTMIKVGGVGSAGAQVSTATSELGSPSTIVNSTTHGLIDGQTITVSAVTGSDAQTALGTWRINVINANAFLIPVATVGNGTAFTYTPLAVSFTAIKTCKDITLPSAATDEIDITTHDSDGKEFMDGDTDFGEVGFDINYDPAEPTHVLLQALSMSKVRRSWQALMTNTPAQVWEFEGWVKTFTLAAPVSGVYTATVAIRVTGAPEVT
jgi:hypothetical protein